jgi:ribosomal protein S18 acetylase RimI-like enzyme
MSALSFSAVDESDRERVFATLVLAFAADPVERWLYVEPRQYLSHFPRFLAAFGGRAFAERTVWRLGEFSAVALWLPPGAEADGDAIMSLLAETVAADKHDDMFAVLGQMDAAHPTDQHWYLPWFAVDTALQGRGLGSQLMEACLRIVDGTHLPAYLETPNPRTIPFYQRHGFEITGEAQAGTCPPITFMLRAGR